MCSGCSGRFDEDGEHELGREGELESEELGICGECGRQLWRGQVEDEFEVLVSAERIVERRVVRVR